MKMKNFIAASMAVALIAGCSQDGGQDGGITKKQVGAVTGAIGGAWVGSNVGKGKGNIAAIAAGTLLGAFVGSQIGDSLDKADIAYYNQTTQIALEKTSIGTKSEWKNPDNDHSGAITPTKTYQTAGGKFCREFTQTVNIGGKTEEAYGTACRQEDGSWQLQQ